MSKCFWPRCGKTIDPERLGCRDHWYRLPRELRDQIWATYEPGQTIDTISDEYRAALDKVLEYAKREDAADRRLENRLQF